MTPQFRAASKVVDRLTRQLLVRSQGARRRRARSTAGRRRSELLRLAERWPWRTNIVGLAVCEKRTEGKRLAGQLVVTFFVQRKLARSRLERDELVPREIPLPDGAVVPTDIQEIRDRPLGESGEIRPLRPGCSLANFKGLAGTMGPLVQKTDGANSLFISCSHVIARGGLAQQGDAIEQPPDDDADVGPHVVGHLTNDFTRLNPFAINTLDVAVAEVAPGIAISNEFIGGGRPSAFNQFRLKLFEG